MVLVVHKHNGKYARKEIGHCVRYSDAINEIERIVFRISQNVDFSFIVNTTKPAPIKKPEIDGTIRKRE